MGIFILTVLLIAYIVLSSLTIKVQNGRITRLETFIDDYMGGLNEHLQKRTDKDV